MIDVNKGPVIFCKQARIDCRRRRHPWGGHPVQKPNLRKPSKVDRARLRLEGAVNRLEEVAGQRWEPTAPSEDDSSAVAASEFEALRDENARLLALNETASQHLDAAIGRLRAVIGE